MSREQELNKLLDMVNEDINKINISYQKTGKVDDKDIEDFFIDKDCYDNVCEEVYDGHIFLFGMLKFLPDVEKLIFEKLVYGD